MIVTQDLHSDFENIVIESILEYELVGKSGSNATSNSDLHLLITLVTTSLAHIMYAPPSTH